MPRSPGQPPAPLRAVIRALDAFAEWTGWLIAWLIVPLIGAMVYEVLARYFFRAPTVWAHDLSYMLYGALFMLGGAYTLRHQGHIRTDFLYNNFGVRGQAFVDAVAYLFFFFPAFGIFLWFASEYFLESWRLDERAISPWNPPLTPFRAILPLAAALLLIQGVAETLKSLYALFKGRWP